MSSLLQCTLLVVGLASSALASPLSTPLHDIPRNEFAIAPLVAPDHPYGTINNSYIVMFKHDVSPALTQNHFNFVQRVHEESLTEELSGIKHVYDGHINGYAGYFSQDVIERLRTMPEVAYIEKDQIVQALDVQKSAPWGLARISHRPRLTFSTFTKYEYEPSGGEGVDVYVIDTGINIEHVEFEGRAHWGKTVPQNDEDLDGNGHGTHCAGTIASRKYGVAKKANVIAVKVLGSNGSGSMSDVIQGVVWAVNSARAKNIKAQEEKKATGQTKHKGSVANMSLGGGKSQGLDDAVNRAVKAGLHFAVAAGNDNRDACGYSPAAAENAVTVGASTLVDERAYFSNYGPCVDVFAPGLNILSTWTGSKTATNTISGTSMASPHTAGLLAYLLSIYPSKQFNPTFDDDFNLISLQSPMSTSSDLYAIAHAALPSWISNFLPPPMFLDIATAPTPEKPATLTPLQLKKALASLATQGILSSLPSDTVNLLIFNNQTVS